MPELKEDTLILYDPEGLININPDSVSMVTKSENEAAGLNMQLPPATWLLNQSDADTRGNGRLFWHPFTNVEVSLGKKVKQAVVIRLPGEPCSGIETIYQVVSAIAKKFSVKPGIDLPGYRFEKQVPWRNRDDIEQVKRLQF